MKEEENKDLDEEIFDKKELKEENKFIKIVGRIVIFIVVFVASVAIPLVITIWLIDLRKEEIIEPNTNTFYENLQTTD